MRFHCIGFGHTQTTTEFSWCAYTQKLRRFADNMTKRGHEVYLYAGDQNEAEVTELITLLPRDEQDALLEKAWSHIPGGNPAMNIDSPHWQTFHQRLLPALKDRVEPNDYLCFFIGKGQEFVQDEFPLAIPVECGIGYDNTFSDYRVYESYAYMHINYGHQMGGQTLGRASDTVIPNSYDDDEFELGDGSGGYALYIGRMIFSKGLEWIEDLCDQMEIPLVTAGQEIEMSAPGDYRGVVGPEERKELYKNAAVTLVPTLYTEPFGGVHVESRLCGTPVITTDWGVFPETVVQGVDGWRVRSLGEALWALDNLPDDRVGIRDRALGKYSTSVVFDQYERYFERIAAPDCGLLTGLKRQRPGG